MELYDFFNSSASYRVRIALALKGLDCVRIPVNIRQGEQHEARYAGELNPAQAVPYLVSDETGFGQSLAIIDYLDARHPEPRLVPTEPAAGARVLELAYLIACDIHPLNNLRVLGFLKDTLGISAVQKDAWYHHWIEVGMRAVETLLGRARASSWCVGDRPTLADCCLIPQIANACRMQCDLTGYPKAMRIFEEASEYPAFLRAGPEAQPDFIA